MRRLNWAFIALLACALAVGAGIVLVVRSYVPQPAAVCGVDR